MKRRKNLNLPRRMHQKGRCFYYVVMVNGKSSWTPLGPDLAVARLKWAELENVNYESCDQVTFDMAAARYEREALPFKAPKTQEEYMRQLEKLRAVFGKMPLDSITPQHVRQYLNLRTAKVAANREKALLSTVFNHAREWGYTQAANPCTGVRGNRETGRLRYIEDKELNAVIACACRPLRDAIELAFYTGQRPSDVLKIMRSDVRDGALWVRQNKTKTPLRIELTGELLELVIRMTTEMPTLKPGMVRSGHLVQTENGQALTYGSLRTRFSKACAAAGVKDFQFRDIRAKSATDTEEISGFGHAQRLLGHKSRSMTEHYVKDRIGYRVSPTPKQLKTPSKKK